MNSPVIRIHLSDNVVIARRQLLSGTVLAEEGGIAVAGLVPPGHKAAEPAIGRVATAPEARRTGLGRALMLEALAQTKALYPGQPIYLGGQRYLERFYRSLGFEPFGEPYEEDGIPHLHMRREA